MEETFPPATPGRHAPEALSLTFSAVTAVQRAIHTLGDEAPSRDYICPICDAHGNRDWLVRHIGGEPGINCGPIGEAPTSDPDLEMEADDDA
jgi:hypothetical protein